MEARRRHKADRSNEEVAAMIPGRTNLQCQNRGTRGLDLATERTASRWKPKVDVRLIKAVKNG
jgi:hypothetical protein